MNHIVNPLLFGVTGSIGVGKTSFLISLAEKAQESGIRIGGFVQKRVDVIGNLANAYDLVRLLSGETQRVATRNESRQFVFEDSAFQTAFDWIKSDLPKSKLILMDEIGLIECEGRGHAKALSYLCEQDAPVVICLSLREKKASEWIRKLSMTPEQLLFLNSRNSDREVFVKRVIQSTQSL